MNPIDPYAPLRRPAFRRYVGGSLANILANQILNITAGFHVYRTTHSAWDLALVGLMSYLPVLLLSLPAGWASDHFPRRSVIAAALGTQIVAAGSLALLTACGGPLWPWFPLLFLAASGRAVLTPSATAMYPMLLEREEVPRGVSWNSATFQSATVLGFLFGGVLLARLGVATTLLFVMAGPLAYLALLPGMRALRESPPPSQEGIREKVLGGFRFVLANQPILGALSVDFVAVLFGGVEGILPMFAQDILRCGPDGLGALKAAQFLGALVMNFFLAHRPVLPRPGRSMLLAVAGFGACMLVFAVSANMALSLAALAAAGMFDQVSVYVRQTMVQLRTPEALKGRVQAVNFLFIGSSNELGEFESGVTAGLLGPVGSVLMGGVAVLVVVAAARSIFPELVALPTLDHSPKA